MSKKWWGNAPLGCQEMPSLRTQVSPLHFILMEESCLKQLVRFLVDQTGRIAAASLRAAVSIAVQSCKTLACIETIGGTHETIRSLGVCPEGGKEAAWWAPSIGARFMEGTPV